jgi:bifunctional non-homologous end joining protein LigD
MPGGEEPSNLDKPFWPDDGLTKRDLLAYMDAMAPLVLPGLRARALTVIRYPEGIGGFSFYQKATPKYAPPWVETVTLPAYGAKKDVRYTVCGSRRTLLWLANQAAIELHPWLSRVDRLDRPTHLVLDIDPPAGDYARAVDVALLARDALREHGLDGVAKTSGSKGVHVYVPLARRHPFDEVRTAALRLAERVVAAAPDLVTVEFRKADRGGRVFLDTTRNGPGAHIVAVYSPRARPGAPVSFPVPWDQLEGSDPMDFTLRSAPDVIRRRGDLWAELMPRPHVLPPDLRDAR